MATGTSRRQALRLGSGGLVAGLLSLAGLRDVAADDTPKPLGKKCRKDAQCESGYCDPGTAMCAVAPVSPTGELTTDDATFSRCGFSGDYYYDTHTYTHGGGPLSVSMRGAASNGGTFPDPYLLLYSSFDPTDPCTNLLAEDDDSGCYVDAYLSFTDLTAGTYTIVATSYSPELVGSYTVEFNTPPPC